MDFYAHIAGWEFFELCFFAVILGGGLCIWLLKEVRYAYRQRRFHKTIHVMDIQRLDQGRSLALFSCPFSRGVVLISPKGDKIVLFDNKNDLENDYR